MKRLFSLFSTLILALGLSVGQAQAKVTLSQIFSDGAIVQRDKPLSIFGNANPGELVTASLAGQKGTAIAGKDGKFVITLAPCSLPGSHELKVLGENLVTVKDVRFGEVWMLAGDTSLDSAPPLDVSGLLSGVKIFKVGVNFSRSPESKLSGEWLSADHAKHNQLALSFAKKIKAVVDCPVAIVEVEGPKAPLRAWISQQGLDSKIDGHAINVKNALDEANFKVLMASFKAGKLGPELAGMSSGIYNGMLAPLAPYTMRGIIWRQGLGDLQSALNYKLLMPIFISDLRTSLKQEQLPLILVQLGAVNTVNAALEDSTASLIRLYQLKARLAPKTYLVLSVDLGRANKDTGNIETDVQVLSERIAAAALSTQYKKPTPFQSPVVELVEPEGNGLKLTLRHVGKGLTCRDKKIKGFAVAGWDHKFVDADAAIEENAVLVKCEQIKEPRFVRYGWGNSPVLSLFTEDGLPLAPFTNDR